MVSEMKVLHTSEPCEAVEFCLQLEQHPTNHPCILSSNVHFSGLPPDYSNFRSQEGEIYL